MSLTRPAHPLRVATVAVVAVVGVNVLIWGGRAQVNGPAARQRPVEIQELFPDESQLMLPQNKVGADLRDEFTGQVAIDGHIIPQDQITGDPSLGQVFFEPGADKDFREISKGSHNATIEWWPREIKTAEAAAAKHELRSYTWAFKVG